MRALAGIALAGGIAIAARRVRSLSSSGAIAAAIVGTACVAAGWSWAILLIVFFVATTALSRWRAEAKAERMEGIVAKGGERDAAQVLANGGLFASLALLHTVTPWEGWMILGAGALAASTADTWSTEIGSLASSPPRSILHWRPVPPGTSGGVTLLGTAAALAGAAMIAATAAGVGWPAAALPAALLGGFAGAMADSLLGATLQARRRCPACHELTEREVHRCGSRTTAAGGIRWLDNDAVNVLSSGAGALVAGMWIP